MEEYSLYYTKEILDYLGINKEYCFIGGQVLKFYNVFRQTSDTDILLGADNEYMKNIIQILKKENIKIEHVNLTSEINDPIGELIRFIFNGVEIDIMSFKYIFQKKSIKNAVPIKLSNNEIIKIIDLPDLIISKIYSGSYKDLADVDSLIKNNFEKLDKKTIEYIRIELEGLGLIDYFNNFFK